MARILVVEDDVSVRHSLVRVLVARDFEQLGDAHAVGAIGLLRKPFTRDELLAVVAAALEKPAQGEIDRPVRT
jgi:DNA-binding response OmpR family regulator